MKEEKNSNLIISERADLFRIKAIRHLSPSAFVIRFEKNGLDFRPGQYLKIGLPGSDELREYSVYSASDDISAEVLIKEVEDGQLTPLLRKLRPNDKLKVKGPLGYFMSNAMPEKNEKLLFIASGTGIAPFHSFVLTHPEVNYRIIHGVRKLEECYDKEHYGDRYISCTSRGDRGDFNGRVTDYLKMDKSEKADKVYLCGNSDMINDSIELLLEMGYRQDQLFTEIYF